MEKFGKNLAELLVIVNKHLNILIYLTKMSKIDENLWTIYKIRQRSDEIRQKSAKIRRKFAKINKNTTEPVYAQYTSIRTCIPVYPNVFHVLYSNQETTKKRPPQDFQLIYV